MSNGAVRRGLLRELHHIALVRYSRARSPTHPSAKTERNLGLFAHGCEYLNWLLPAVAVPPAPPPLILCKGRRDGRHLAGEHGLWPNPRRSVSLGVSPTLATSRTASTGHTGYRQQSSRPACSESKQGRPNVQWRRRGPRRASSSKRRWSPSRWQL